MKVEKDVYGGWTIEMVWGDDLQGGPVTLTVRPTDPDNPPRGGISQTVLREINFTEAASSVRTVSSLYEGWEETLRSLSESRRLTDDYLTVLSAVYSDFTSKGGKKPLEHLQEITGKSNAAVKSHLWQATRRGLLARSPGRRSGSLTAKGEGILFELKLDK
ncbi:HTH DNA binding protein [Mycobacterium phage Aeneas]|uniref:Helix-turn-helix DNA binding domain protein n=3 Tax=Fromanvirus TaxID=186764 RepID=I3WX57_9CAUD|nr:HTH DNA binding protein [Mycobacterium phage PhrostyMug]YP_009016056.1 HTH DNA binding protein [Mycobacterium phage Perseus]YP_009016340.1 HTH DNA binding protein [Mycobacterium phage Aeneas]YP_009591817.1 HTH DNA binding protein [Mycobacterium phage Nepal]AGU92375.1 hypothetical protein SARGENTSHORTY9_75 [Mycobacterium phage SargentShorty9]ASZ74041.1 helix-turn-helix DNA binding domain protein [Mycobacterium phage Smairt]QNL30926.1 helix-turn-helix DNA binding domain protein [Mycobacteriu